MALFLEPDAENISAEAQADLDALSALRESAAIELKEKGNEYLKMGKRYYKDAIDCYTRAIEQKSMDMANTSILYSNRAHVHLLLGNNRYAFDDAHQAAQLNKANVKAYFRGAKAGLGLELLAEAMQFCSYGLQQDPNNLDLLRLKGVIDNKLKKSAASRSRRALEVAKAEVLSSAITVSRRVSVGRPAFREHTKGRKPWLDDSEQLHWPVLLLYPEYMASDFIEDFCELDTFSSHLDVVFGPDTIAPWDTRHEYTRENVQLFFQANGGPKLSKMQLLSHLLEDKNIPEDKNCQDIIEDYDETDSQSEKWLRVSEKSSLHDVLSRNDHIIPGIPVFYVLSKGSKFSEEFLSGHR